DGNLDALVRLPGGRMEPYLLQAAPGARYQFERLGYFCVDLGSAAGKPVFNRTVTLRDTWAKIEAKGKGKVEESKSRRVEESKSRKVEEWKGEETKGGR